MTSTTMAPIVSVEEFTNGSIGQVSGREYMWNFATMDLACATILGQMHFQETAVDALELAKRMQGFANAGALSPAAADTCSQSHNGHAACSDRVSP